MTTSVSNTPDKPRSVHASSHGSTVGDQLFLEVVEERYRHWHRVDPERKALRALRIPGLGSRSVKLLGYPASKAFTYFIRFEIPSDQQPIKIGVARNPVGRRNELRVGSPYPMALLGMFPDELLPERYLHEVFADCRLSGEWFRPTDLLLSLIDAVARAHPLPGRRA